MSLIVSRPIDLQFNQDNNILDKQQEPSSSGMSKGNDNCIKTCVPMKGRWHMLLPHTLNRHAPVTTEGETKKKLL